MRRGSSSLLAVVECSRVISMAKYDRGQQGISISSPNHNCFSRNMDVERKAHFSVVYPIFITGLSIDLINTKASQVCRIEVRVALN